VGTVAIAGEDDADWVSKTEEVPEGLANEVVSDDVADVAMVGSSVKGHDLIQNLARLISDLA
jgi:hypothetical protein